MKLVDVKVVAQMGPDLRREDAFQVQSGDHGRA
jgi:hypothetical protein